MCTTDGFMLMFQALNAYSVAVLEERTETASLSDGTTEFITGANPLTFTTDRYSVTADPVTPGTFELSFDSTDSDTPLKESFTVTHGVPYYATSTKIAQTRYQSALSAEFCFFDEDSNAVTSIEPSSAVIGPDAVTSIACASGCCTYTYDTPGAPGQVTVSSTYDTGETIDIALQITKAHINQNGTTFGFTAFDLDIAAAAVAEESFPSAAFAAAAPPFYLDGDTYAFDVTFSEPEYDSVEAQYLTTLSVAAPWLAGSVDVGQVTVSSSSADVLVLAADVASSIPFGVFSVCEPNADWTGCAGTPQVILADLRAATASDARVVEWDPQTGCTGASYSELLTGAVAFTPCTGTGASVAGFLLTSAQAALLLFVEGASEGDLTLAWGDGLECATPQAVGDAVLAGSADFPFFLHTDADGVTRLSSYELGDGEACAAELLFTRTSQELPAATLAPSLGSGAVPNARLAVGDATQEDLWLVACDPVDAVSSDVRAFMLDTQLFPACALDTMASVALSTPVASLAAAQFRNVFHATALAQSDGEACFVRVGDASSASSLVQPGAASAQAAFKLLSAHEDVFGTEYPPRGAGADGTFRGFVRRRAAVERLEFFELASEGLSAHGADVTFEETFSFGDFGVFYHVDALDAGIYNQTQALSLDVIGSAREDRISISFELDGTTASFDVPALDAATYSAISEANVTASANATALTFTVCIHEDNCVETEYALPVATFSWESSSPFLDVKSLTSLSLDPYTFATADATFPDASLLSVTASVYGHCGLVESADLAVAAGTQAGEYSLLEGGAAYTTPLVDQFNCFSETVMVVLDVACTEAVGAYDPDSTEYQVVSFFPANAELTGDVVMTILSANAGETQPTPHVTVSVQAYVKLADNTEFMMGMPLTPDRHGTIEVLTSSTNPIFDFYVYGTESVTGAGITATAQTFGVDLEGVPNLSKGTVSVNFDTTQVSQDADLSNGQDVCAYYTSDNPEEYNDGSHETVDLQFSGTALHEATEDILIKNMLTINAGLMEAVIDEEAAPVVQTEASVSLPDYPDFPQNNVYLSYYSLDSEMFFISKNFLDFHGGAPTELTGMVPPLATVSALPMVAEGSTHVSYSAENIQNSLDYYDMSCGNTYQLIVSMTIPDANTEFAVPFIKTTSKPDTITDIIFTTDTHQLQNPASVQTITVDGSYTYNGETHGMCCSLIRLTVTPQSSEDETLLSEIFSVAEFSAENTTASQTCELAFDNSGWPTFTNFKFTYEIDDLTILDDFPVLISMTASLYLFIGGFGLALIMLVLFLTFYCTMDHTQWPQTDPSSSDAAPGNNFNRKTKIIIYVSSIMIITSIDIVILGGDYFVFQRLFSHMAIVETPETFLKTPPFSLSFKFALLLENSFDTIQYKIFQFTSVEWILIGFVVAFGAIFFGLIHITAWMIRLQDDPKRSHLGRMFIICVIHFLSEANELLSAFMSDLALWVLGGSNRQATSLTWHIAIILFSLCYISFFFALGLMTTTTTIHGPRPKRLYTAKMKGSKKTFHPVRRFFDPFNLAPKLVALFKAARSATFAVLKKFKTPYKYVTKKIDYFAETYGKVLGAVAKPIPFLGNFLKEDSECYLEFLTFFSALLGYISIYMISMIGLFLIIVAGFVGAYALVTAVFVGFLLLCLGSLVVALCALVVFLVFMLVVDLLSPAALFLNVLAPTLTLMMGIIPLFPNKEQTLTYNYPKPKPIFQKCLFNILHYGILGIIFVFLTVVIITGERYNLYLSGIIYIIIGLNICLNLFTEQKSINKYYFDYFTYSSTERREDGVRMERMTCYLLAIKNMSLNFIPLLGAPFVTTSDYLTSPPLLVPGATQLSRLNYITNFVALGMLVLLALNGFILYPNWVLWLILGLYLAARIFDAAQESLEVIQKERIEFKKGFVSLARIDAMLMRANRHTNPSSPPPREPDVRQWPPPIASAPMVSSSGSAPIPSDSTTNVLIHSSTEPSISEEFSSMAGHPNTSDEEVHVTSWDSSSTNVLVSSDDSTSD